MAGNGNSGRPSKPAALHLLQGNRSKKNFNELIEEIKAPAIPVAAPPMPDEFLYRITRQVGARVLTVEVAESEVPPAVRACVRDELL